jgi:phage minor structural protein
MIQTYKSDNTDYSKNGDIVLFPISAKVTAELNKSWSAEMTCPIDPEGRWKYIEDEAVVKMPSFNGDQLFRIKAKTKSDSGITATLEPIFYDAMDDCFLVDVRPTDKNGQDALDIMTAVNNKYKGSSNISKKSTAYYQFKNLIEAINGNDDNSFISRWGGEILFDNYMVIINDHIGEDNGVELRYGKNIPEDGMSQEVDMREVVTRIYPKAYNGWTMTNSSYVDSPLINSYPTIKIATITFEDVKMREDAREGDEEEGIIVCDTQEELDAALKEKCNQQFEAGLDKPKVTISADMILLQNTEQYKDYAVLENVSLGDTIHCINNHLGITTTARVISLVYDSILKKVDSVVIGEAEYNYFNNVTSSVNRIDSAIRLDGSVVAEQIKGFIDGTWSQLRIQNTAAKKQDVRAILFEDLDPDSETFGALSIGTQGLQISRRRTAANDDWIWTTALTAGGLIADIINGGTISGVKIVSPASMPNLRSDIVIENGVISSEGEILSINRSFQLYTGSLRFDVKWDDGTKQKAELNANGLYAFYGEEIDQNTITVAARDTGGIVQVSNKNGDYVSITPGHLTIFRDGKTIVEY